jgi:flagellar hook-associated protein 3 FlgL
MRITVANTYQTSVKTLQQRQQALTDSQTKLTSGKRVEVASDDPVAAARAERALARMMKTDANQRALESSRNVMQQAETSLGDAGELLQQARELVVEAGNGSHDDTNRATIANAIKAIRDQLLGVANRTDGATGFVFGGQGTDSPPFVDAPGGVVFQGAGGHTEVPAGEPLPTSVDGAQAWLRATDASTGASNLSVFDVLDRIVAQLKTPGQNGTQIAQDVQGGLRDIDSVSDHLLAQRASAGQVLNRTDAMEQRNATAKLSAQTERSSAEDLDMVAAVSDFQNQQSGYDAALKAYSMVHKLSLFDYVSA